MRVVPVLGLFVLIAVTAGLRELTTDEARLSPPPATERSGAPGGADGDATRMSFDTRVRTLEAHVASAPADRALRLALARLLHDGHRESRAIEHYREAIELDPSDGQAFYDLATAHGALGEWARAADVLEERLASVPDDAVAMYDLGAVLANTGRMDEAAAWFERTREIATDSTVAASATAALTRLAQMRRR